MRNLISLDDCRDRLAERAYYNANGDGGNGVFRIRSPIDQRILTVVASNGEGWDHVSISREKRAPNWRELDHVKRLFFKDTETVMQLHVPVNQHINIHPYTLHLWRPQNFEIPRPPGWMV